jgi:hypothetical protein
MDLEVLRRRLMGRSVADQQRQTALAMLVGGLGTAAPDALASVFCNTQHPQREPVRSVARLTGV